MTKKYTSSHLSLLADRLIIEEQFYPKLTPSQFHHLLYWCELFYEEGKKSCLIDNG